jgi:hypothetical protein
VAALDLRWIAVAVGLSAAACLPCDEPGGGNDGLEVSVRAPEALRGGSYRVAIAAAGSALEAQFRVVAGELVCDEGCVLRSRDGTPAALSGSIGSDPVALGPGFLIQLTARGRGPDQMGIVVERDEQILADVTVAPPYYDQESCSDLRAARFQVVLTEPGS